MHGQSLWIKASAKCINVNAIKCNEIIKQKYKIIIKNCYCFVSLFDQKHSKYCSCSLLKKYYCHLKNCFIFILENMMYSCDGKTEFFSITPVSRDSSEIILIYWFGTQLLWIIIDTVTNPVHRLPLTHHQRSLAHHMDSCTTLTVALHLRLQFPSPIALTMHALNTQLIALNTLLIALNTQLNALITQPT